MRQVVLYEANDGSLHQTPVDARWHEAKATLSRSFSEVQRAKSENAFTVLVRMKNEVEHILNAFAQPS